jgi:hypothetical protein
MDIAIKALYAHAAAIEAEYAADTIARFHELTAGMDLTAPGVMAKISRNTTPDWLMVQELLGYDGKICQRRLALRASWFAMELCSRWSEKLNKIGECSGVTIQVGQSTMAANWTRDGRACSMISRAVVKVNANGTMFVQYPTRMKVDGASVTEAGYNVLFT